MNRMRHVDGKEDCLSPLRMPVVLRGDITNELGLVHSLGKLGFAIVAHAYLDALEIGPHVLGSEHDRLYQHVAPDHLLGGPGANHPGKDSAQAAAVTSA